MVFTTPSCVYKCLIICSLTNFRSNGNRLKCRSYCLQNCQKDFIFFATIQKTTFAKLWWLHLIANAVDAKNASFSEQHCVTILFLCNSLRYTTTWPFLLFISFYSFIIDLIISNEILRDTINQLFYSIPNLNCLVFRNRENVCLTLIFFMISSKNYNFLSLLNKVLEKLEETSQEHKCQTSY